MSRLQPVIMEVPASARQLKGRETARALSQHARVALMLSAELSGVILGSLTKSERGAPLPSGGIYWSLSHTVEYVAAVTAPHPVGIDIEKIQPFTPALQERLAGRREWELAEIVDDVLFCRYWTAKEALLKAVGIGLGGLKECNIMEIRDDRHLRLLYDEEGWIVSHSSIAPRYLAAITAGAAGVKWHYRPADRDPAPSH